MKLKDEIISESAIFMDVDFIVDDLLKGYSPKGKVYTPFKAQVIGDFFAMLYINVGSRYNEDSLAMDLAEVLHKINVHWRKPMPTLNWANFPYVSFNGEDPDLQYITTHLYETDYRRRDFWDDLQKIKSKNPLVFEYLGGFLQHYLDILEIKPNHKEPSELVEGVLHCIVREKLQEFEKSLSDFLPYDTTPMISVPVEDNIKFLSKNERYVLVPDKQSIVFSKIFDKTSSRDLELEF